jgi:type 1 fimbriae regulatory protein FimB
MSYSDEKRPLSDAERALLRRLLDEDPQPAAAPPEEPGGSSSPTFRARRKKNQSIKYLTEEEIPRLFAVIRAGGSVRDLAIFELGYHRGLRASEVALIQVGHWRPNQQRLYVTRLKNGISGEYLVTDREAKALRAWTKKRPAKPGPLFVTRQGNKGISRFMLDKLMRMYASAAGIPGDKHHFHCLRHSCATALLERDVPIEEVQDHLGHQDIRSTSIYAKVTNTKRRRKDERLKGDW